MSDAKKPHRADPMKPHRPDPMKPGRPQLAGGPVSAAQRQAESKARLIEAGGLPLKSINLSPEAAHNLRFAKEALGLTTNKDAVEQALSLLAKKAAKKSV